MILYYTDGTSINLGSIYVVYQVQFKDFNGLVFDVQHVPYGSPATLPDLPYIKGYDFAGWSDSFDCVTTDLVIYALYDQQHYSVEFDSQGGSSVATVSNVSFGTSLLLPSPTREGYTFMGWYYGTGVHDGHFSNGTIVERNLILYARWEKIVFAVDFVDYNGTIIASYDVAYGKSAGTPASPSRTGYTFVGWSGSYSNIQANTIVTAIYQVNSYTITFNTNGGSEIAPMTLNYNASIAQPTNPTKNGYSFDGWFSNAELTTQFAFTAMPAENTTLYAKWVLTNYALTYELNGGVNSQYNPESYTILNTSLVLEDPTKQGYSFNGWYDNASFTGSPITSVDFVEYEDLVFYAKWTINTYAVKMYVSDENDLTANLLLLPEETIIQISSGSEHTMALTSQGRVFTWGSNSNGQLVNGTKYKYSSPCDITRRFNLQDGETIVSIDAGKEISSAALTSKGRLFMWGYNQYGQLGDSTYTEKTLPVDITNNFNLHRSETIIKVSIGSYSGSAITSEGRLFMWGQGSFGEIASGDTYDYNTPNDVTENYPFIFGETPVQVSFGKDHSTVLTSLGRIFTCGKNTNGQLGNNTQTDSLTPINITTLFSLDSEEQIISISNFNVTSVAMTSSGRVFAWGTIPYQFGFGSSSSPYNSLLPMDITSTFALSAGESIVHISQTSYTGSIRTSNGRVFMWGLNSSGQIGDGTMVAASTLYELTNRFSLDAGETIAQITNGSAFSSALSSSGRIFTWGDNSKGQLGIGSMSSFNLYIQTLSMGSLVLGNTLEYQYSSTTSPDLAANPGYFLNGWFLNSNFDDYYTCGPMPAHDLILYAQWIAEQYNISYELNGGTNNYSNPGSYYITSDTITLLSPTREQATFDGWYDNPEYSGSPVTTIASGTYGSIVLYAKWIVATYTVNRYIVNNYISGVNYALAEGESVVQLVNGSMHSGALTSAGRVLVWGANSYGQLGIGTMDIDAHSNPIDITDFLPLDVVNGETITKLVSGRNSMAAITSAGRLFLWGENNLSQYWTGEQTELVWPTDVTNDFNLDLNLGETITEVSLGGLHAMVLTSLNRLFVWGDNSEGQLGNGTSQPVYAPFDITSNLGLVSGEGILKISAGSYHSMVLTSTNRVIAWGRAMNMNPVNHTALSTSVPIDITSMFSMQTGDFIVQINAANNFSAVLSSMGDVFTWGWNGSGQLGNGTTGDSIFPATITSSFALTPGETITQLHVLYKTLMAMTSAGRVFTWGSNVNGQVGNGTTINTLSPVDITASLNIVSGETIIGISAGDDHCGVLTSNNRYIMWGANSVGQLGNNTTSTTNAVPVSTTFPAIEKIGSSMYEYNSEARLLKPLLNGFTFRGWYSDLTFTTSSSTFIMPAETVNVYGYWLSNH